MNRANFLARVDRWSMRLRVRPVQVRIQVMARKWASCSSRGRVTFARDLMNQSVSFQDYVIAHELLHLRIPNHGKLFVATLQAHLRGNRCAHRQMSVSVPTSNSKHAAIRFHAGVPR